MNICGNCSSSQSASETAFNLGRIFRSFYELDLGANETLVFKFEVTGDVVLESSAIDIDAGGIRYAVYSGGVEGGTFDPLTPFKTNNVSGTPAATSNVTISVGGTLDVAGVEPNDVTRVLAANANSKQSTVGVVEGDMRGFPATTAYVVVEALDGVNSSSTGTIKWLWHNA